jgi:pimeloyl-ACP methyl ester carboxylesterase
MIVQRVTLWYPEHVIAVAAICVPFVKPAQEYLPLEKLVERFPNFAYQLWFASEDSDRELSNDQNIEKFLKGVFRIKGDEPVAWNTGKDILKNMGNPSLGRVWENKDVFQYYLRCFQRTGTMRGPLTYYKTRELNYKDELKFADQARIECPALFVGAEWDVALPPTTWGSQGWVPQLEMQKIDKGHWCLVEDKGKEIAPILHSWVRKVSEAGAKI